MERLRFSLQLPYMAIIEDRYIVQNTVDYGKHNQVVSPTVAAVPDVVFLPEQINTTSGTGHAATDLENTAFLRTYS